ncbi:AI-2E family transporter [Mesorhizobium sp. M0983]|uniref:AI-2E family transporter n=1 Tax=Mesorhizobium sp. M0983 TaxID=2957040 RepID=UPI00333ACA49
MAEPSDRPMVNPLVTGVLVVALVYFARAIFMPLAFSLFVIALVWPIQAALQKRVARPLALLITLLFTITVIVVVGSAIVWGFSKLAQWLFYNSDRLQTIYANWATWLEGHGIAVAGAIEEHFNVTWLVGVTQGLIGRLNSTAGLTLLACIFVMLGLLEADDFRNRLCLASAQPYGELLLQISGEIGSKVRRFMIIRSIASVFTGVVVWMFALVAGLELATAWGAMAFALNYIPFIGPLTATIFPTLFAIAQSGSWQLALVVFIGLNVIQFVIGSYLEPSLAGASLAISPFAVVFAVFFWSFMWGLPGAFIGVPILIVVVTYCAHEPSKRWIAALLSGGQRARALSRGD